MPARAIEVSYLNAGTRRTLECVHVELPQSGAFRRAAPKAGME